MEQEEEDPSESKTEDRPMFRLSGKGLWRIGVSRKLDLSDHALRTSRGGVREAEVGQIKY